MLLPVNLLTWTDRKYESHFLSGMRANNKPPFSVMTKYGWLRCCSEHNALQKGMRQRMQKQSRMCVLMKSSCMILSVKGLDLLRPVLNCHEQLHQLWWFENQGSISKQITNVLTLHGIEQNRLRSRTLRLPQPEQFLVEPSTSGIGCSGTRRLTWPSPREVSISVCSNSVTCWQEVKRNQF